MQILSCDIGGSKIAYAIVDENKKIVTDVHTMLTPVTVRDIKEFFMKIAKENDFDGFALATAGVVLDNKLVGKPNNLPEGYENIDWTEIFRVPIVVENDANAAMWAEYKLGNLRGVKHGVMLTLGTDVGCGIICNGQVLKGKGGAAGEVHFECSGSALKNIMRKNGGTEQDCFKIKEMSVHGDMIAQESLRSWEENLLSAIQEINNSLDTEVFILSGSLAKIVDYVKINTMLKILIKHGTPQVKPAICGTNAGLIGAAMIWGDTYV